MCAALVTPLFGARSGPSERRPPLFVQMANTLREQIRSGTLARNARLPSEATLGMQFGCCRVTVRDALALLAGEGLIISRQGRGSFVADPKAVQELTSRVGFHAAMRSRGSTASSQVVSVRTLAARREIRHALRLPPRAPITEIQRRRIVDDRPVALQIIHVCESLGALLVQGDLTGDLQPLLENALRTRITHAAVQIEAVACPQLLSGPLALTVGSPILRLARTTFGDEDQPLAYELMMSRGDSFELRLDLPR